MIKNSQVDIFHKGYLLGYIIYYYSLYKLRLAMIELFFVTT